LDPAKNPNHLVQGTDRVWRVMDSATLLGDTATVESAMKTIGAKIAKGQSVRIALNLEAVKNDGATFAIGLKAGIRADQQKPVQEQITRGLKELVIVKNGKLIQVIP
jgi:hypothetical protein